MLIGNFEHAAKLLQEGLDISRQMGDRINTANCLYNLGSLAAYLGDFDAYESSYREALNIRHEMGDLAGIAVNTGGLAWATLYNKEDITSATRLATQALEIAVDLNHIESKALALMLLGLFTSLEEDYIESQEFSEEAHSMALNPFIKAIARRNLAMVAYGQTDLPRAREHIQKALKTFAPTAWFFNLECLLIIALILVAEGDVVQGIRIMSLASSPQTQWLDLWPPVARMKAEFADDVYSSAWKEGKSLDLDTVIAELLAEYED